MAGRLDSAGGAKMKTLDDALLLLQRINGLVEQYGLALKSRQPTGPLVQNIRRTLPQLAGNLTDQFGLIAEQVTALNLNASRGSSETVRLRQLREGVAQIRQSLEIATAQVRERHLVRDDSPP
jgi:hypothetical protein